jgi:hypothetical protein
MPRNDEQLPAWGDLDFSNDLVNGFGYRWYDSQELSPQFPFGYGLSYTTFEYGQLSAVANQAPGGPSASVTVDVTNIGSMAGETVVQLYLSVSFSDPRTRASVPMPMKQLRGFERVALTPGQTKPITFALGPEELSFWSVSDNSFRVEAGTYTVYVGESSSDLPLSGSFELYSPVLYDSAAGETAPAITPLLENVALDRPATCSSIEDDKDSDNDLNYDCAHAVDGNLATRWSSQFSDPQWITVDLGAQTKIKRVILRWEVAFGKSYQIQASDDAVNWTAVYNTAMGNGGVDNLDLPFAARYVRLLGTQRGTIWGFSLWDLEVYGSQG